LPISCGGRAAKKANRHLEQIERVVLELLLGAAKANFMTASVNWRLAPVSDWNGPLR
jgi:hypothetical protein